MALLNNFAKKYGITVLTAGDFDQSGVEGLFKISSDLEGTIDSKRSEFIRSPKLGISLRTANRLKTVNLMQFLDWFQNRGNSITLHYFENEKGLFGDKLYEVPDGLDASAYEDEIRNDIELMLKTSNGERIGYIYNDEDSPIFKLLSESLYKDKITFYKGNSSQGFEGNYYIIDLNENVSDSKFMKDLYTGIYRSKIGSIAIIPSYKSGDIPTFNNRQDLDTIEESLDPRVIKKYSALRKARLDKLITVSNPIKYIPRTKDSTNSPITASQGTPPAIKQGLNDGIIVTNNPEVLTESNKKQLLDNIKQITNVLFTAEDIDEIATVITSYIKGDINSDEAKLIFRDKLQGVQGITEDTIDTLFNTVATIILNNLSKAETASLPITNTDIIADDEYKDQIDHSTETDSETNDESLPKPKTNKDNSNTIKINMILHSFNTFETGIDVNSEVDSNGNIGEDREECNTKRIDSINGLYNKINRNPDGTIKRPMSFNDYVTVLGKLRSVLLNVADKTKLESELSNILQSDLDYNKPISVVFAYKSSANPSKGNIYNLYGNEYDRFSKSVNEQLEYIYSNDTRSKEIRRKSLVAIIGNEVEGDLLEIPLLTFTSPITIMRLQDDAGNYVFDKALQVYEQNSNGGSDIYGGIREVINQFDGNTEYLELVELCKLWTFTQNGVFLIRGSAETESWTPAGSLEQLGPQFETRKNKNDIYDADGFSYDANWITLSELASNPSINMSNILTSSLSSDDIGAPVLPGHPFVLVSYDKSINNLGEYYVKQFLDSTVPKKVKLVYILPPKASIEEYIDNIHSAITTSSVSKQIGNKFTSYRLLYKIFSNPDLKLRLKGRYDLHFKSKLDLAEVAVNELHDLEESANSATDPNQAQELKYLFVNKLLSEAGSEWKNISDITLSQTLDGLLHRLIYKYDGSNKSWSKLQDDTQFLTQLFNDAEIDGVYYQAQIPNESNLIKNGQFIEIILNNYQIDGRPTLIHGKVDSPAFRGNMSWFVHNIIENKIKERNDQYKTRYSIDTNAYINGEVTKKKLQRTPKKNQISSLTDEDLNQLKNKTRKFLTNLYLENAMLNVPFDDLNVAYSTIATNINALLKSGQIAFVMNTNDGPKLIVSDSINELVGKGITITKNNLNVIEITNNNSFDSDEYLISAEDGSEYVMSVDNNTITLTKVLNEPINSNTVLTAELLFDDNINFEEFIKRASELSSDYDWSLIDSIDTMRDFGWDMMSEELKNKILADKTMQNILNILQKVENINNLNEMKQDDIICNNPFNVTINIL